MNIAGADKMTFNNYEQPMKTITILLTRYKGLFGRFICGISKNKFSHASISLDENEEIFYSFNLKGFVIEKPKKYFPESRIPGSTCVRIQVPCDIYDKVKEELTGYIDAKEKYGYSRWGVVLCLLHISHKFQYRYFCSQFVAEILNNAGAVKLRKASSLYLPGQLIDGFDSVYARPRLAYNEL